MRWFSFVTKFTFLCNICFLVAVTIRYMEAENLPQWVIGTVLTLGWFLSVLMNIVFLAIVVYLLLSGRRQAISPVLTTLNILIGIFQFIYFLILP